MNDNVALASKCVDVLCDNVGIVEAEKFVYLIKTEAFDYTSWQREHYDSIAPETLRASMKEYCREHPFQGKKAKRL